RRPSPHPSRAGPPLCIFPSHTTSSPFDFSGVIFQRFNLNFQNVDQVGGAVRGGRARESQEAVLPGLLPLHPPPTCQHPGASTGYVCRVESSRSVAFCVVRVRLLTL